MTTAIPNAGVAQDPTLPEILPLLVDYGWGEKNTKLPRATMDSFIEFSGQLQDAATGTGRPYALISDEMYEPKRGHKNVEEYLRAGKADGPIELSRKTESKADFVAAHKAGAVPLKVKPLSKIAK